MKNSNIDLIEEGWIRKKLRGKISDELKKIIYKRKKENNIVTKPKRKFRDRKHIKIFKEYRGEVNLCQKCGGTKGGLQIHHIDKNHNNNEPFNLIKLCLVCHCEAHKGDNIHALMISRLNFVLNKK